MESGFPNREALMKSIHPSMKLTRDLLRCIYAYELSFPGFAEEAIAALEGIGCSRAREHYVDWVSAYKMAYGAEIVEAAAWYVKEFDKKQKQKEGEYQRSQKNNDFMMKRREKLIGLTEKLKNH